MAAFVLGSLISLTATAGGQSPELWKDFSGDAVHGVASVADSAAPSCLLLGVCLGRNASGAYNNAFDVDTNTMAFALGEAGVLAATLVAPELDLADLADAVTAGKAARATRTAADTAGTTASDLAKACANSFTGDTPVTMADGSMKPIKDVKVGDRVIATDPQTGQTKAEPVVALIRHSGDHAMVLVTLADGSVLDVTNGHKIWDATRATFVDADHLAVGDKIETTGGALITVRGLTGYSVGLTAYNLQIDQIHTYYAGSTPVLVHNSCDPSLDAINIARHANEEGHVIPGVNPDELDSYVHGVMQTRGALKVGGGQIWWDSSKDAVVIRNPDGYGTTFVPDTGINYYLKWKAN